MAVFLLGEIGSAIAEDLTGDSGAAGGGGIDRIVGIAEDPLGDAGAGGGGGYGRSRVFSCGGGGMGAPST